MNFYFLQNIIDIAGNVFVDSEPEVLPPEVWSVNMPYVLTWSLETWSGNSKNFKAFIMSYNLMLRQLHRAQIF